MKHLGMILLVIGVALSASFGARLSPPMRGEMTIKGKAKLLKGEASEALRAWCKAVGEEDPIAKADGCVKDAGDGKELTGAARLAAINARAPAQGEAPERKAWVAAETKAHAAATAAAGVKPVPPSDRLSSWFDQSGVPFSIGLVLVIVGAVLARRTIRAEALGDDDAPGAVDFGQMLQQLLDETQSLAEGMADDSVSAEDAKTAIEKAQLERFAPLIEARGRLQARYGLSGYAEVFGPLSSAERRVNRAWSALVDGHQSEARKSVSEACESLVSAHEALTRLAASA